MAVGNAHLRPDEEFELTLWGRYARGGSRPVTGHNCQAITLLL